MEKFIAILLCSKIYSSPKAVLSWFVVFVYSLLDSGNIFYGILSLIGLCAVHFGANFLDDYFVYKSLINKSDFDKSEYLNKTNKLKCYYLLNGYYKDKDVLSLAIVYFVIALIISAFLYFKVGAGVFYFALIGAIISLIYPFLSKLYMSEILTAIAYGPAVFCGVYYVMCGRFSYDVFLLSLPIMFMTVVLVYMNSVLDYQSDVNLGKKTIANSFDSQLDSLIILKILLVLAYISLGILCIFDILDWQVFIVCFTIPVAIDMYKSMIDYSCDSSSIPDRKWYNFPISNKNGDISCIFRLGQARCLMIYFSLLLVLAIILSLAI